MQFKIIFLIIFGTTTWAQVPVKKAVVAKKPEAKAVVVDVPAPPVKTFTLDEVYQKAVAYQAEITQKNEKRKLPGSDFDICEAALFEPISDYNQWFISHIQKFKDFAPDKKEIDTALGRLRNVTVNVNPVERSTSAEVPVTLDAITSFMAMYHERAAKYANEPGKLKILDKIMEDPTSTSMGIASSQIQKALDLLTNFLNVKQKETPLSYNLKAVKTDDRYNIVLVVTVDQRIDDIEAYQFEYPLIQQDGRLDLTVNVDGVNTWASFAKTNLLLEGKPVDGFARYFDYLKDPAITACLPSKGIVDFTLSQYASYLNSGPFVTYEEWSNQYELLVKKYVAALDGDKAAFDKKYSSKGAVKPIAKKSQAAKAVAAMMTDNICYKSQAVRDAILDYLKKGRTLCAEVNTAAIANIGTLVVRPNTGLQADDFSGLVNVTKIDLAYSALSSLPEGLFNKLPRLIYIDLSHNNFTTLPENIFTVPSLKYIVLLGNPLKALPETIFDYAKNLVGVWFDPTQQLVQSNKVLEKQSRKDFKRGFDYR